MKTLKTAVLSLFFLFMQFSVHGQAAAYVMTPSVGTFTPVSGGTTLPSMVGNDVLATISLPFTFDFEGTGYTQLKVTSNGYLTFNVNGAVFAESFNDLDNAPPNLRPLIAPLWDDLDGRAPSPKKSAFQYLTSGVTPNRVMTLEWLNWEWGWQASADVISFQVKLYETTNEIEFVYRPESTTPSRPSASIGLSGASTFLSLQATTTAPAVSYFVEENNLSTRPQNGQIYKFTPPTCPAPDYINQTNASSTSMDVSWTGGGANHWQVTYGAVGHVLGTGISLTTTAPFVTITGLNASTCYDVYVRDSCGPGDVSMWHGPIQMCTARNAPYLETFDTNTTYSSAELRKYVYKNGWFSVSGSQNRSVWNWITSSSLEGPRRDHTGGKGKFMVGYNFSGTTGDSAWLYSPFIDFSSLSQPALRLWYHKNGNNPMEIADIIIEADTNGSGSWFVVDNTSMVGATHTTVAPNDPWSELLIQLDGFTGVNRFRIVQEKQFCCDHAAIDDFEIFDMQNKDLKMVRLISPVNGDCAGDSNEVVVEIQNIGSDTIFTFDLAYQFNGGVPVNETVNATLASFDKYSYTFNAPAIATAGLVPVLAWTNLPGDGNASNDTLNDTAFVSIAPVFDDYLYCYGFENGNEGWTIGGFNSSWEIALPIGLFIKGAAGGNYAAVTDSRVVPNQYEMSYLQSPCFDFSAYQNDPVLEFQHIYDMEDDGEKSYMEMSTDGGKNWNRVGAFGQGTNWYDDTSNTWTTISGPAATWRKAGIGLAGTAGKERVKLRFVFESNDHVNGSDEGVGVDDVAVVVPPNDLFADTLSICSLDTLTLDVGGLYPDSLVNYTWSNGDTTPATKITVPGNYSVKIEGLKINFSATELFTVIATDTPVVSFSSPIDTIDFFGGPVVIQLSPQLPAVYDYVWTSPLGITNQPDFTANPSALGVGMHSVIVAVTDTLGCTGNGEHGIFVSDFVGIGSLAKSVLHIYPNPASDFVTVKLSGRQGVGELEVSLSDHQGRTMERTTLQDFTGELVHKINISGYAPGVYFIQVASDGLSIVKKIMVK